ncbi:hypothetical protein AGMMS50256_35620 [Betaproteobacteria bacterium]|nr:hypothetical protein AGMMS50256_35620 [Betaproteobacteria bacterium]
MDITSAIATSSALNSTAQAQNGAQLRVLNKALDTQVAGAAALIQAIPTPPPSPVSPGQPGGLVNTWA